MKVDLKPESERDIEARLKSEKYADAGDVITAALQALSEKEIEAAAVVKAEASFARYQVGAPARPWPEVKPEMDALLQKRLAETGQRDRT